MQCTRRNATKSPRDPPGQALMATPGLPRPFGVPHDGEHQNAELFLSPVSLIRRRACFFNECCPVP